MRLQVPYGGPEPRVHFATARRPVANEEHCLGGILWSAQRSGILCRIYGLQTVVRFCPNKHHGPRSLVLIEAG